MIYLSSFISTLSIKLYVYTSLSNFIKKILIQFSHHIIPKNEINMISTKNQGYFQLFEALQWEIPCCENYPFSLSVVNQKREKGKLIQLRHCGS